MDYCYIRRIFEAFESVKSHDQTLTDFVYQHLIPIIDRFVAMYRIDDRYLCHIDWENLVGDLIDHFLYVVEQYERRRWADCHWNRVHYILISLRREATRLLHKELDRFRPSSAEEKYEITVSTKKWEQIDMDVRYSEFDWDEFRFDIDRWNERERTFLRLLLGRNKLTDIATMMDLSYASVRRIRDRLMDKLRERYRV